MVSECATFLAVSAITGALLICIIPILVFRTLTIQNWFDMNLDIPVDTQLGIFCKKKKEMRKSSDRRRWNVVGLTAEKIKP